MLWLSVQPIHHRPPRVTRVEVHDDWIYLELLDSRRIRLPTAWSQRLLEARPAARERWELLRGGEAVRWPELGELLVLRSPDPRRPDPPNPERPLGAGRIRVPAAPLPAPDPPVYVAGPWSPIPRRR